MKIFWLYSGFFLPVRSQTSGNEAPTVRGEREVPGQPMVQHREAQVKTEDKEEKLGRGRERERGRGRERDRHTAVQRVKRCNGNRHKA